MNVHNGYEVSSLEKADAVHVAQSDLDGTTPDQIIPSGNTTTDNKDMNRMGKRQEFVREFRQLSIIAFASIVSASWEFSLFSLTPALLNGGLPSLLWSTIWTFICFTPILLSLAEMASMAPTAGGQYHWVSEFAPERYQRLLSYLTGYVFGNLSFLLSADGSVFQLDLYAGVAGRKCVECPACRHNRPGHHRDGRRGLPGQDLARRLVDHWGYRHRIHCHRLRQSSLVAVADRRLHLTCADIPRRHHPDLGKRQQHRNTPTGLGRVC